MDGQNKLIKRLEEYRLIRSIKRGDREAANRLVTQYYREIYAFAYRQTADKELSMDLTQEVFISALKTIDGYDSKKSAFRTWLYRVASNKLVDYFRSREYKYARLTVADDDALTGEYDERSMTAALESKEDARAILDIISALDARSQHILRLKIFGGRTFAEIGAMISMPESSVKTRYYALIRRVRAAYGEGGTYEQREKQQL